MIGLSLGSDPNSNAAWPVYVSNEPSYPDNCITLYDTMPRLDGRTQIDGKVHQHYGFQLRVRGSSHTAGYVKADALADALNQSIYHNTVTISGSQYCVQTISRVSGVIALGRDAPTSQRYLFTANFSAYILAY